jgi:predicted HTH domain antitoxin
MAKRSVVELEEELEEELEAVTETGLYKSREAFLTDAVRTLFAARPDVREAAACRLYEKGVFSLGRAAAWAGISIEDMKESLHRAGISREAPQGPAELEAMARRALKAAGRSMP